MKSTVGAVHVAEARGIHEHVDARRFEHVIVLALLVERQGVLEARAAAAAHAYAQADLALGLLAVHELADLLGGDLGESDHSFPNCIGGLVGTLKTGCPA